MHGEEALSRLRLEREEVGFPLLFLPWKTGERMATGRACPEPVEGASACRQARVSVYLSNPCLRDSVVGSHGASGFSWGPSIEPCAWLHSERRLSKSVKRIRLRTAVKRDA